MRRAEKAGGVEVWGPGVPARRTPPSCRDNAAKRAAILRKNRLNVPRRTYIPYPRGGWVGELCRGHTLAGTEQLPTSGGQEGQHPVARGGGRRRGGGKAGGRQGREPGKPTGGQRKPPPSSCRDIAARRSGQAQPGGPPSMGGPPDRCRAERSLQSDWRRLRGACGSLRGRASDALSSTSLTSSPSNSREGTAPVGGRAREKGTGTPTDAGSPTSRRTSQQ